MNYLPNILIPVGIPYRLLRHKKDILQLEDEVIYLAQGSSPYWVKVSLNIAAPVITTLPDGHIFRYYRRKLQQTVTHLPGMMGLIKSISNVYCSDGKYRTTVAVTGSADSFSSIRTTCRVRHNGKQYKVTGSTWVHSDGTYRFTPHSGKNDNLLPTWEEHDKI